MLTLWLRPNGLPMAMVGSPSIRSEELPRGAAGNLRSAWIFSTARSPPGSVPTTFAV